MTSLIKAFAFFAFLGTISTTAPAESNVDDHLIPIEGWLEPGYKELLTRKLFVTPANYARVVEFPTLPSLGEVSLAIYSKASDPDGTFITRTKGERNLWSAEFGSDPSFPKGVRVVRCDARFPKSTAVALQGAVKRMLDQSRPLENRDNAIILDANIIEFSIEDPQRGRVGAFLSPYAIGKIGAALRRITQLLAGYCDSTPPKRAALAKRIEVEAQGLK
jgi:hypothetical protein